MAGIYIHIPFCKTRCSYCDFFTGTNETRIDDFVGALCREVEIRKGEIDEPVKTLYFGGGTPSRLHREHFDRIFDAIRQNRSLEPTAEITLEANPDDLSEEYVEMLSRLPFNRLSIGIQSFNDKELAFLSRRHSAQQAIDAVKRCQRHHFSNISIDLMYGLPRQSREIWLHNLEQAVRLNIPHLSAYHLIYEAKTRMHRLLQAGKITPVEEEESREMFTLLMDELTRHGFLHYEISALAKEGYLSRHNSAYWKNVKYIGLGPSAHSFDGNNRSRNVSSLSRYIAGVEEGILDREYEQLTTAEKYNETILTGLRTMWGVDLSEVTALFGDEFYRYCLKSAKRYLDKELLRRDGNRLKLTREGFFISDGIMSDLMWVG